MKQICLKSIPKGWQQKNSVLDEVADYHGIYGQNIDNSISLNFLLPEAMNQLPTRVYKLIGHV